LIHAYKQLLGVCFEHNVVNIDSLISTNMFLLTIFIQLFVDNFVTILFIFFIGQKL